MPSKTFTFDGVPSSNYGIYISGNQTFNGAEREVEKVSIPGRSGDLILPSKRFKNVPHRYDAWIAFDLDDHAAQMRNYLLSRDGYCRLEDDYHPNEFYLAQFTGPIDFDVTLLTAGETTLEFDRMPQRFLKTGETAITVAANATVTINNPTLYEAEPLIEFKGATSGTIVFNTTHTITIANSTSSTIILDSSIHRAYHGTSNLSKFVTVTDDTYPVLRPGNNTIRNNSSATLKITPRWYII